LRPRLVTNKHKFVDQHAVFNARIWINVTGGANGR
jgi:hypothetical protein